jgi:hypothetical protein
MRVLALARFRFLTIIRRLRWVFPVLVIAIVVPGFFASGAIAPTEMLGGSAGTRLGQSAFCVSIVYIVQMIALPMLCWSFGIVPPRPENARPSDLMDLIPLRGQTRFWGDALGIYAASMSLHLCTTPLLAMVVAASPLSSSLFWWLELAFALVLFLVSASASLTLRSEAKSWTDLSGRRGLLVILCYVLVLTATTKIEQFPDALAALFNQPSRVTWLALTASIDNLPLFVVSSFALYAGFIGWYSIQASRAIERA